MRSSRIDLLRHGECEGGEIFRGATDVDLTEEGVMNMRDRLARISTPPWQRVISSPLRRCLGFAQETADRLNAPLHVEDDLREMHFGDWEGRAFAEIWQQDDRLRLWGNDPEKHTPPGGESLADFAERVDAVLRRLVHTYPNERLLIITHGGVIRLLLAHARGIPRGQLRDIAVPYAYVARLSWDQGRLLEREDDADADDAI